MKTSEIMTLKSLISFTKVAGWTADAHKHEYDATVKRMQETDVMVNALRLMLRGEKTLTKEMSERLFPTHTRNLQEHLKQISPMAEKMYLDALLTRRDLSNKLAYSKQTIRREIIKHQRLLTMCQMMEKYLRKKWEEENPDLANSKTNLAEISNIRDKWMYHTAEFNFEIISEAFGARSGFHARITEKDSIRNVIIEI